MERKELGNGRWLFVCGMLVGPFYLALGLAQAFVREGFDLGRHALSVLANGPGGWVQTGNFILSGFLVIAAAIGIGRVLRPQSRVAGWVLGWFGVSMLLAAVFRADPVDGFPVGTPLGMPTAVSTSGLIHFAAGASGFLALAASCIIVGVAMARRQEPWMARLSFASGVSVVAGFFAPALLPALGPVAGIWFSVVVGWMWLTTISAHLYRAQEPTLATQRFYHGTRTELRPGDLIEPGVLQDTAEGDGMGAHVYLTPDLDGAIWEAEIAAGEDPGRVYVVEPSGQIEDASGLATQKSPGHPFMSYRSRDPLRVLEEVTEWPLYHGTRADLEPGDLIEPGHTPNFGNEVRTANHVYLARTLDAAIWGAELAVGEGPGRIYIVEPTGPIEDDPNLTDKKFRGNPTKSFRSRDPLRVTGEITEWQGHSPEALEAMKDGLRRLERLGVEPIDD